MYVLPKGDSHKSVAGVAAGLAQLRDDVIKGQIANLFAQFAGGPHELNAWSNKIADVFIQVLCQTKQRRISFGMHGRIVQRVYAVGDSKKARCLLERLLA